MNTTPIEFMAWDERTKTLGEVVFINFSAGAIGFWGMTTNSGRKIFNRDVKDVELMQLTAIHSIKDEPIYNHMIVKDEYGCYGVVNMFNYSLMNILSNRKLEIAGNRFQSPELLELCK